jgi:hypothetical protein
MAYLGRQPLVGNYQVLDAIVATTTDTYALTKDTVAVFPQTPSNCIVSLNGVIQAPVSSYTISGSNIVFDSALTGSDSIDFITVLGDVLSIGTPTDGTVSLAKLSATGTKDATTFLRGDNTFASAGGVNTPAFRATMSSTQSISNDTPTKVQFDTEDYDIGSCYDNSTNYRFTPNVAGKYVVGSNIIYQTTTDVNTAWSYIYKNGSIYFKGQFTNLHFNNWFLSSVVTMNGTTDYIEIYAFQQSGGSLDLTSSDNNQFFAYKIIE